jgi:limonene-1,2-epoxide hydrolase
MTIPEQEVVYAMCDAMVAGSMDKVITFLSDNVFYHNLPLDPIQGKEGVRSFLAPFVEAADGGLESIEYLHSMADGPTVMNARDEIWRYEDVIVNLPVAGVFHVENGLIHRWCDYWDLTTMQPILDRM